MDTNTKAAGYLVTALFVAQLAWFIMPVEGSLMGNSYRHKERFEKLEQYRKSPSEVYQANIKEEMELLYQHEGNKHLMIFGVMLLADAGLFFALRIFLPKNDE